MKLLFNNVVSIYNVAYLTVLFVNFSIIHSVKKEKTETSNIQNKKTVLTEAKKLN